MPSPAASAAASSSEQPVQTTFHANTQLADGRSSLLVDPGSKGNLGGSKRVREQAEKAQEHKHPSKVAQRDRPLQVMGVGNGAQSFAYDCTVP